MNKIIVEVRGGCVQDVYCEDDTHTEVWIVDWDNYNGDAGWLTYTEPFTRMPKETHEALVDCGCIVI